MANKKLIGGISTALVTAGAIVYLASDKAPSKSDLFPVYEKDQVSRVYAVPGKRSIRLVGIDRKDTDVVVDDVAHGRAVQVNTVPEDALCNILLDATEIKHNYGTEEEPSMVKVPNVPELLPYFGKVAFPVKLERSKEGNSYIWNALLQGEGCAVAAGIGGVLLGSSTEEFNSLPPAIRSRVLRSIGNGIEKVQHSWSGRPDLNFVEVEKGKPKLRYDKCKLEEYKDQCKGKG